MSEAKVNLEDYCEQKLNLLRSHHEKQTNVLLDYFSQQYKIPDSLSLIGKRFKDKEKQFASLRKQNQQLRMETLNLKADLQKIRLSGFQDSKLLYSMQESRQPQDTGRQIDSKFAFNDFSIGKNMTESVLPNYTHDTSEYQRQFQQIKALKQKAQENYTNYAEEFDKLIIEVLTYLRYQAKHTQLKQVKVESSGSEDNIIVPRKNYQKLIEVYAMAIADVTVNKIKQSLSLIENKMNMIDDNPTLKQLGQNLLNIQRIGDKLQLQEVKDLGKMFQVLSTKIGFEKEWRRYHSQNLNQSIKLNHNIDFIVKERQYQLKNNQKEQKDALESQQEISLNKGSIQLLKNRFLDKLDSLVKLLDFKVEERNYWQQLRQKIFKNKLIDSTNLVNALFQKQNQNKQQIYQIFSKLITHTVSQCAISFEKIVSSKFRKTIFTQQNIEAVLSKVRLNSEKIIQKQDSGDSSNLWLQQKGKQLSDVLVKQMAGMIEPCFVFTSMNSLHRFTVRNK